MMEDPESLKATTANTQHALPRRDSPAGRRCKRVSALAARLSTGAGNADLDGGGDGRRDDVNHSRRQIRFRQAQCSGSQDLDRSYQNVRSRLSAFLLLTTLAVTSASGATGRQSGHPSTPRVDAAAAWKRATQRTFPDPVEAAASPARIAEGSAQPAGSDLLDPSFGTGGKVQDGFQDSAYNSGRSVAFQQDGRTLFTGFSHSANIERFAVSRATVNGKKDATFGDEGTTLVTFDGHLSARSSAVLVQPNGRIVAAGMAFGVPTNSIEFAMARLLPSGQLDSTFGNNGRASLPSIPDRSNQIMTLSMQADGKILAGGRSSHQSVQDVCAIARVNADGSPDMTFGSGGLLTFEGSYASSQDFVSGIAQQSDGRILAAIQTSDDAFLVMRILPGGVLDDTFGVGGRLTVDLPGYGDVAYDVAVRPDDRFAVTGYMQAVNGAETDAFVVQFDADGNFDPTFGVGGIARVDHTSFELPWSITIDPAGRVIIGGIAGDGQVNMNFAARLTANGAPDPGYGVGGVSLLPVPEGTLVYAFAVHPSGYSMTCGDVRGDSGIDTHLVRRTPAGVVDPTFDFDGQASIDVLAPGNDALYRVIALPDGNILAFGYTRGTDRDHEDSIVRYRPDGSFDPQFAQGGRLSLRNSQIRTREDMAVQPDGKIVVCGTSSAHPSGYLVQVERYLANGGRDVRFGQGGLATVFFSHGCCPDVPSIAVAPDGRITLAGHRFANGTEDAYVARLTSSGKLDRSFGGGIVVLDTGNDETFAELALQADGSVVACGRGFIFGSIGAGLVAVRFLPNGQRDPLFGVNGVSVVQLPSQTFGIGSVLVQPDGRTVICGSYVNSGGESFRRVPASARLERTGRSDVRAVGTCHVQLWHVHQCFGGQATCRRAFRFRRIRGVAGVRREGIGNRCTRPDVRERGRRGNRIWRRQFRRVLGLVHSADRRPNRCRGSRHHRVRWPRFRARQVVQSVKGGEWTGLQDFQD